VFFDTLGVPWEYEPQGYHLPDGQLYLPDFLLTHTGLRDFPQMFVEIKPLPRTHDDFYYRASNSPKCGGLATPEIPLLLVYGDPFSAECYFFAPEELEDEYPGLCLEGWASGGCHLDTSLESNAIVIRRGPDDEHPTFRMCSCCLVRPYAADLGEAFEDARVAARSARFEFGESG
jgi:hypothetical protein